MLVRLLALATLLVLTSVSARAADWSRFRGPNGNAFSEEKGLPTKWSDSAEDGLVWKTSLPGAGASSPVIAGDKVFVTCYKGQGPGPVDRSLVCVGRKDGKILWEKSVKGTAREDAFQGMGVPTHGYASNTPVTDGKSVFAFFGKAGVYAYDLDGNELWHKSVGTNSDDRNWGSGTSPILYKDMLIVNAAAESKTIYALDKATGKQVWKSPADSLGSCWATPILVDAPGGKQELVVSVPGEVWGFNPDTGEFAWFCEGVPSFAACTSAVAKDGVIYVIGAQSGGGGGGAVAIKAGGKDDVTKTHRVWEKSVGSYVTSPVIVGDHLYWVSDGGQAFCVNLKDGETVYRERIGGGAAPAGGGGGGFGGGGGRGGGGSMFYASAVACDGKLYAVSRNKGIFVLAAEPKYQLLATNKMEDTSVFNAGPAIQDGQIYLRSDKFLYCIGKK